MKMLRTAFSQTFNNLIKRKKDMEDPVKRSEVHENLQEWEVKDKEKGEEFAKTFADFVNIMSDERQVYAILAMTNQHRTLQQNMTRFCVAWLEHLATLEMDRHSDLRNEDSMKLAQEFVKIENRYLRNI